MPPVFQPPTVPGTLLSVWEISCIGQRTISVCVSSYLAVSWQSHHSDLRLLCGCVLSGANAIVKVFYLIFSWIFFVILFWCCVMIQIACLLLCWETLRPRYTLGVGRRGSADSFPVGAKSGRWVTEERYVWRVFFMLRATLTRVFQSKMSWHQRNCFIHPIIKQPAGYSATMICIGGN